MVETPQNGLRVAEDARAGPIRVLIVDDHEMFASSLAVALSHVEDIDVVGTAPTLAAARRQMSSLEPDVVLLDHHLPDGLGVDSISDLKHRHQEAKIVVLTGAAEDSMLVAATEAGCAGFVLKTSPLGELIAAVRTAASGEMLVSTAVLSRLLGRLRQHRQNPDSVLTSREREILQLISEGLTNAAISKRLYISVNTVRNHVQNVLAKLGVHSKLEALSVAVRDGLIKPPSG